MRIKRLDITGFKSFMERSVFTFGEGVTGIVGPNGCGKSNVVDAIRWVMGEQSAKNLRGRGMEDVIFNGSESHAPLSMAEVSLTFKLEDGDVLAPQYAGLPEVCVTRRLFRSGESEYLINRTTCRLLDITELLLGTGVGTKAYSIIEQGRVGLIVSAKPEDRRAFIEEAAGVTKYKARRRAAERKMEYTEQNLLRVRDIAAELEKRLESLNRQAKKAEKYKKLRAEVREIDLHAASHRYLELSVSMKVQRDRLESLTGEEKEAFAQVQQLEEGIVSRRAALDADAAELDTLAESTHALEAQVQLDEQNLSHWLADAEATKQRLEHSRTELAQLEARERELKELLVQKESERQSLELSDTEDAAVLQASQEELRQVTSESLEVEKRLEQERGKLLELTGRLANHESNLANLVRRREDLESRRAKLAGDEEALRAEEKALEELRLQRQAQIEQSRRTALELAQRRGQEEQLLVRTREAFAESEMQVIHLREELADKRSRLNSLQEIQRNYEGFDRGVRAVMLQAGDNPEGQGILGLVADVLSTESRYESAVEAALGEKLQHVIVDTRKKGFELAEYLRTASEGRSSFIPLDGLKGPGVSDVDLTRPGVVAAARSVVQCSEGFRPLAEALLGDVVIVSDLSAARACADAAGGRLTWVTLEGEVVRADGVITGGALEGPAVGVLQKKREIAELETGLKSLEERYQETVARHQSLQKQIGQTEGVLKGLSQHQHDEELAVATQERDLHRAGEDLAKLRERLGALQREATQLADGLQALEAEEQSSRGQVAHGQADRELHEERIKQWVAEAESLRSRNELLNERVTTLRVKVAATAEKDESTRKEIEQLTHQAGEVAERLTRLNESLEADASHLTGLEGRMEEVCGGREERRQTLETTKQQLEARREAHGQNAAQVRSEEVSLKELRTKLDVLTQGLSELSLQERELKLELEHLVTQVRERHQTELVMEVSRFHQLKPLSAEAEQRLKELRHQIERMGEINLTAIEEAAELTKRFDFLTAQRTDLESSLEQLRGAIQKIDKTSRERFKQTFDIVNEKFQQIFPRLFGGGRASLVLTDENGVGEPGVEIIAQPPGKKLQSVGLLSGGEKALTAVSLIFAIFLIKPTPFCLLDEVDAPLDEANVGRYNEMVREMSKQSQFIVITHNKRTMEVVDTLYGVTMEEPGISKLVSVRLHEAASAAANSDVA